MGLPGRVNLREAGFTSADLLRMILFADQGDCARLAELVEPGLRPEVLQAAVAARKGDIEGLAAVFGELDVSKIEGDWRILASLAKCSRLAEAETRGGKVHVLLALAQGGSLLGLHGLVD
jgi:hypothetical protein